MLHIYEGTYMCEVLFVFQNCCKGDWWLVDLLPASYQLSGFAMAWWLWDSSAGGFSHMGGGGFPSLCSLADL